jgi:hypothetical protein
MLRERAEMREGRAMEANVRDVRWCLGSRYSWPSDSLKGAFVYDC